jgi:hypothetical protein
MLNYKPWNSQYRPEQRENSKCNSTKRSFKKRALDNKTQKKKNEEGDIADHET